MGTHKRVKFPMDVSKENSKDMYKLKFIRKSEMEPTVRHHLKHAVSQMDKQVDVWFKEQSFTIGTISKQQDKLSQSRRRLKKEQRRIKKKEYARQQEETRSKLHAIRLRIMLRKAIQKFRANVVKAREYRNAELDKLGPNVRRPDNDTDSAADKTGAVKDVVVVNRSQETVLIGIQRFPSTGGRLMEPIPEEDVEVELEEDNGGKPSQRLTKRHLHQLNRTTSTRSVLDIKATVPLLPDLHVSTNQRTGRKLRRKDASKIETETSLGRDHNFPSDESTERSGKKTKSIVVKLPVATRSPKFVRTPRSDSFRSGKSLKASVRGSRGSDTDLSDSDSESDKSNASVIASVSETESWNNTSDYESSYSTEEFMPDEVSLTFTRYTKKKRKTVEEFNKIEDVHPHRHNFPDERILPELALLSDSKHRQIQNPYLSLYKDRSFYIESNSKGRLSESKISTKDDLYISANGVKHKDKTSLTGDIPKDDTFTRMDETAKDMAVFGKKADYNARKQHKTPPNTPASHDSTTQRISRSQLSVIEMNKKRAQSLDKYHTNLSTEDEPFQRYEKSKSGKLMPVGSPKAHHAEFPSMRDRYQRDKLLKMERDTQFNQNMKMKRFFSSFDKGDLSPPTGYPPAEHTSLSDGHSANKDKAFTNFVFKILGPPAEDSYTAKEIVPRAETTSVRLLKNCRYLREYKPVSRGDNLVYPGDKETSWQMKPSPAYTDKYLANVRLKLF